jgi:hypothetical protein
MKTLLFPLILKQELLDLDLSWEPVNEDKLSEILGTIRAPVSSQSEQNPNKYYPTLNTEATGCVFDRQKSPSITSVRTVSSE